MKKIILLFTLIFYSGVQFSQNINIDQYQYIIVPNQFDFLKMIDQYQTSSLTKFLFQKKGFKVFLSDEELPEDLANNRCTALTASVNNISSMLRIRVLIEIKDCYGKVLYTSEKGTSKVKDFKRGYQQAIKNAFETMSDFEYSYNPNLSIDTVTPTVVTTAAVVKSENLITNEKDSLIKNEIISDNKDNSIELLYAQPKEQGYQLIDTKPEVIFTILKTSKEDFYIIKNKNGTLFKKDNIWVVEYYENGEVVKKKYKIKF